MNHDPVTRWLSGIAVVLLTFILVWALLASVRSPSVGDRLDRIENQFTYVSCLLLIPIDERVSRGVAECQLESPPGGN